MLDQSIRVSEVDTSWHARARQALQPFAWDLARKLEPDFAADKLVLHLVKLRLNTMCLRADLGHRSVFLKIFDSPASESNTAYKREKFVLGAMKETGIVPALLAYHDKSRILVLDHVDGFTFEEVEATACPVEFAGEVGTWVAKFESHAPSRPDTGNWAGYFGKLRPMLNLEDFPDDLQRLSEIPVCGSVISRNDPAMHNFILPREGGIVGCDFGNAQFRPRGWEFLLTYQALLQRFPEQASEVLAAFVGGFRAAHTGAMRVEEICQVARIMIRATALSGRDTDVERID